MVSVYQDCDPVDLSVNENLANMKEVIAHISTGEVTYAVKDTKMNGVDIKKDEPMMPAGGGMGGMGGMM